MPTKPLPHEYLYENRMKYVVRKVLDELGVGLEKLDGDELAQKLWENNELLGRAVVQDMFEWMAEDDWLELVKNG